MEQDYSMGCVFNAFKLALHALGRPSSAKELSSKLGLTDENLKKLGVPGNMFLTAEGDLYTKLQIDRALVFGWAEKDYLERSPTGLQTVRFNCISRLSSATGPRSSWLFHGLLKFYLAKGLPVILDIYVNARMSHVITVLGYDEDKRSYLINMGNSKEIVQLRYTALDTDWSRARYSMIVLSPEKSLVNAPVREYQPGARIVVTGTLEKSPETPGFLFVREKEFSNGILVPAALFNNAQIGRPLNLTGVVREQEVTTETGKKKQLVLEVAR